MTLASTRSDLAASVVIPAYNRLDLLRAVLEAFAAHEARARFEVIVVDDGSSPPVSTLLAALPDAARIRLVPHGVNRGRGAAVNTGIEHARSEVVIVCDSDIVPAPGLVDDHLSFHAAHPDPLATHLGRLEWGVEPGALGEILGARSNPRLGAPRRVDWTEWYTDNWSAKRALFGRPGLRFDEGFRAWGWEDLDLAWRLRAAGATNDLGAGAAGLHLKAPAAEGAIANFARSAPNLLRLAANAGPGVVAAEWLSGRFEDGRLLGPATRLARAAVAHVEAIWPGARTLARAAPRLVERLRLGVSNALFAAGMAEGLAALPAPARADLPARTFDDRELLLRFVDLPAVGLIASHALGPEARPEALVHALRGLVAECGGGELLQGAVTGRLDHHLRQARQAP